MTRQVARYVFGALIGAILFYCAVARADKVIGGSVTYGSYIANPTGAATGDILYTNSTGAWVRLPVGSNTQVLTLAAGIPSWAAAGLSGSGTQYRPAVWTSTTALGTVGANGASGTLFRSAGTGANPTWSTTTFPDTFAAGDLVAASAANVVGAIAAVAAGSYLRSAGTGTIPVWSTITLPNALTTGDTLVATGTNAAGVVAAGTVAQALIGGGAGVVPAWGSTVTATAAIGTTQVAGWTLDNNETAGSGSPKYSPGLILEGNSYNTSSAASESSRWMIQNATVSGAGNTGNVYFWYSANGGAWTNSMAISSSGTILAAAHFLAPGGGLKFSTQTTTAVLFGTNTVTIQGGGNGYMSVNSFDITDSARSWTFAEGATSGATARGVTYTGAAHTALTAGTEKSDWNWNGARSVQWATGALATQRQYLFQPQTITFVGASTATDTATVAISGPPVAGTNATITRSMSLWVQDGRARFDGQVGIGGQAAYPDPDVTLQIQPPVATSGTPTGIQYNGAAHTTLTASAESIDVNFNLNRTVQYATGAITTQRGVSIAAPTYAFAGASTISDAATFYITGAPSAGTNATITRSMALWAASGLARFDGNVSVGSMAGTGTYVEVKEMTAPSAPSANLARIYAEDNGSGKTRLCALFASGAAQCFATEP